MTERKYPLIPYILAYKHLKNMCDDVPRIFSPTTMDDILTAFEEFAEPRLFDKMIKDDELDPTYRYLYIVLYPLCNNRLLGIVNTEEDINHALQSIKLGCK